MSRIATAVLATTLCSAASTQTVSGFSLRADYQVGSNVREVVASSSRLPLDKRFEQLSSEERSALNGLYAALGPTDEPPYPAEGLGPLVQLIHKGQAMLLVAGDLYLIGFVDETGQVKSVKAIGSPSPQMTDFASKALLLTKFKPARCGGTPCQMQFPVALTFVVR